MDNGEVRTATLKVKKEVYDAIIEHARESYPHECCGLLVGTGGSDKKVLKSYRTQNTNKERAADRYEIDPRDFLRIEKEAAGEGLSVIGIYHSHPDHPSRPSVFDRERGWPELSYIIVSVNGGGSTKLTSWSFANDDEPFGEEEVVVVD